MTTFMLAGDKNYATSLTLCVQAIHKLYPTATTRVYDWGLLPEQRASIAAISQNVQLIDWATQVPTPQPYRSYPSTFRHALLEHYTFIPAGTKAPHKLLLRWLHSIRLRKFLTRQLWLENMFIEKIRVIKDAHQAVGHANLVFLDADALLVNTVDELLDDKADITVTVRRPQEVSWQPNRVQVVNAGVIFFGQNSANRAALIDAWYAEAITCKEYLTEQSGLSRVAALGCNDFTNPPTTPQPVTLNGTNVTMRYVPCETYNFNWVEQLTEKPELADSVKILHFKGARHQLAQFIPLWDSVRPLMRSELRDLNVAA